MADTQSTYSDNTRFTLYSEGKAAMHMDGEPGGWREDELELIRNSNYHGVFTQFTNPLRFYNKEKDYILSAFKNEGVNATLYLVKSKLKQRKIIGSNEEKVVWTDEYVGVADFEEMIQEKEYVSLNFNSNNLETTLKALESTTFELERKDSIDNKDIGALSVQYTKLNGRNLIMEGHSEAIELSDSDDWHINDRFLGTVPTTIITRGPERHVSVDSELVESAMGPGHFYNIIESESASNMFFVDSVSEGESSLVNLDYDVDFIVSMHPTPTHHARLLIVKYKYDINNNTYVSNWVHTVLTFEHAGSYKAKGSVSINVDFNESLMMLFSRGTNISSNAVSMKVRSIKQELRLNVKQYYPPSVSVPFLFVDQYLSRLLKIITGKNKKLYSRIFGREGTSEEVDYNYFSDGEYGLIGLTNGLWIRGFRENHEGYKSIEGSFKDAFESLKAVFNIGLSVENRNGEQVVRIEDLKYFYQDAVGVRLPFQISNVKRSVDKTLLFKEVELGYSYSIDNDNSLGADEPNAKTSFVTPLRKTSRKYSQISKFRSDDYQMETMRRKNYTLFPDESTSQDNHIWLLDLKRTWGNNYVQKEWSDRLKELPKNILSPETFNSFFFIPSMMLKRHAWVIKSGMEQPLNMSKYMRYANSTGNTKLETFFIGEDNPVVEGADVKLSDLDKPRFLAEIVEFDHPVSDDLMDKILGTTPVMVNGEIEEVPNYYLGIEFINENGEKEIGYLLSLKPKKTGRFKLQIANKNIL